jgi:hypothetical protein
MELGDFSTIRRRIIRRIGIEAESARRRRISRMLSRFSRPARSSRAT